MHVSQCPNFAFSERNKWMTDGQVQGSGITNVARQDINWIRLHAILGIQRARNSEERGRILHVFWVIVDLLVILFSDVSEHDNIKLTSRKPVPSFGTLSHRRLAIFTLRRNISATALGSVTQITKQCHPIIFPWNINLVNLVFFFPRKIYRLRYWSFLFWIFPNNWLEWK